MAPPLVAQNEVTQLLLDWGKGDKSALDKLMPLVYGELRKLARRHLHKERPGQTLQTTDLIHETYLKLVDPGMDLLPRTTIRRGDRKIQSDPGVGSEFHPDSFLPGPRIRSAIHV
jgi:ECF sigma factor